VALVIAARKLDAIVPSIFIKFTFDGEPRLAKGQVIIRGNLVGGERAADAPLKEAPTTRPWLAYGHPLRCHGDIAAHRHKIAVRRRGPALIDRGEIPVDPSERGDASRR
jgi:hypothetical protein